MAARRLLDAEHGLRARRRRSVAREFASRGARLGLIARDEESLEETKFESEELGARASVAPADVADPEGAADAIEEALGPSRAPN